MRAGGFLPDSLPGLGDGARAEHFCPTAGASTRARLAKVAGVSLTKCALAGRRDQVANRFCYLAGERYVGGNVSRPDFGRKAETQERHYYQLKQLSCK